jgi:hypothetical protein
MPAVRTRTQSVVPGTMPLSSALPPPKRPPVGLDVWVAGRGAGVNLVHAARAVGFPARED